MLKNKGKNSSESDKSGAEIGVIDSGVGGISTLAALMAQLPCERFVYLADKSGAPYGNRSREYILERMQKNSDILLERGVKAIVVACNTATNVGITRLRECGCIFVGLEPAIKPAFSSVKRGKVLVLLTCATAQQEKFRALIAPYDTSRLIISPQAGLAKEVEENIGDLSKIRGKVEDILKKHQDVAAVVLGCTHYVFLKGMIEEFYKHRGEAVEVFDGNSGAARQLAKLLAQNNLLAKGDNQTISFLRV